jgi:hypothetical protein
MKNLTNSFVILFVCIFLLACGATTNQTNNSTSVLNKTNTNKFGSAQIIVTPTSSSTANVKIDGLNGARDFEVPMMLMGNIEWNRHTKITLKVLKPVAMLVAEGKIELVVTQKASESGNVVMDVKMEFIQDPVNNPM